MPVDPATRRLQHAATAVFVAFFLNGANVAAWAARLPAIRDGLGLSQGQMGLLLLVGSIGSLASLPVSGLVVERWGARRTVLTFAVVNAIGLVVAASGVRIPSVAVVVVGLVLFGTGIGVWDAAMNLEGAAVEQGLGRTVMPRFHAGFSFGTMAAAGVAALVSAAGVPVAVHVPIAALVATVAVVVAVRWFLDPEAERTLAHAAEGTSSSTAGADPATAVPAPAHASPSATDAPRGRAGALAAWREPRTLMVGLVVLAAGLTEGAANDWVSLAVVDGFEASHAIGALAFGLFVTAMTAMRLLGTGLVDRMGRPAVLRATSVLALVGLLLFCLAGPLWLAMVGVVAWGLGAALGFPLGLSAAADDPARAPARVSVASTIGYTAFLAGPPLLGFIAQHVGYRSALLVIAVPVLLGLLVTGATAPLRPATAAARD